jgi:hypothetical protein
MLHRAAPCAHRHANERHSPHVEQAAVQLSIGFLLASAVLAAPLAAQNPPASNTAAKPVAHAESLGSAKKRATTVKKAQPAKTRKATDPAAKPTKPARKTWTGGRNGYVVDSAEAASLWPVKGPAPLPGAILPAKRIVAYYGNPLVKKMGILGELPPDEMLARFDKEIDRWRKADPTTPVQPALHLIAVVAQGSAGRDGMWRLRMSDSLIERVYSWAQKKNAILFLDVQVGHSTVQQELPRLAKFLERPDVHLGIDPEFSMKHGEKPGTKIGTFDAADVNYAVKFLADLVEQKKLPPKVLVVHRFTRPMLTNTKDIRLDPRVQIVINMDGWGPQWMKLDSYHDYVYLHPVQYTGFKLFYHNDTKKGGPLLTPEQVLKLIPKPVYIQYQ